jgi:NAD+ synthase
MMVDLRFSDAELEQRREHIVSFIDEQITAADADGAVLALSGGVDSSLTAFLAVEALGADDLYGLVLPATVNRDENMSDAEEVVERLEIDYDVIEVSPVIDELLEGYPDAADDQEAVGNARARVRGVYNYLVANHENRVVLGTGNRSEGLTGYFTKYGDQAVDCNPIGNLYKTQVWQLAEAVGVPQQIVEKPPTAGLWEEQTDEGELGLEYETLDRILALYIDGPLSAEATVRELDVSRKAIERVESLYEASAHKRAMPPAPDSL